MYDTTGNVSSALEQELVLPLICKELAAESSDPGAGSLEVLPACRGSTEGRGFAGLCGGQEAWPSWAQRGGGIMLYTRQSLGVGFF